MFSVKTQHSDPCTTAGLIRALYNFILVFLDISLLWSIIWFAKEARLPAAILSFISSTVMLSLVTIVPRYLVLLLLFSFLLFLIIKINGFIFCCHYLMLCAWFSSFIHLAKGRLLSVHTIKVYRGSSGIAPPILNIDCRWSNTVVEPNVTRLSFCVLYSLSLIFYHKQQNNDNLNRSITMCL